MFVYTTNRQIVFVCKRRLLLVQKHRLKYRKCLIVNAVELGLLAVIFLYLELGSIGKCFHIQNFTRSMNLTLVFNVCVHFLVGCKALKRG